jgi:predicted NUDIX family NTP pyrophosphohydrolase
VEVLLIHPGGPFWRGRGAGAWMIPKGALEEELGARPEGMPRPLCRIRQKGGKWVEAFALEGDFDPALLSSNSFRLEYPPKSGRFADFPEVDEAAWFALGEAHTMILPSQAPILDALEADLA